MQIYWKTLRYINTTKHKAITGKWHGCHFKKMFWIFAGPNIWTQKLFLFWAEWKTSSQTFERLSCRANRYGYVNMIQWISEYPTSLVFKWSKRGWIPKGSRIGIPFEYRTAWPFEFCTIGHYLVFLCTGPVFEWLV